MKPKIIDEHASVNLWTYEKLLSACDGHNIRSVTNSWLICHGPT